MYLPINFNIIQFKIKKLLLCVMVKLNLPSFHIELKKEQDRVQIFDLLRKRYVVLTPEEWVRQHFIHYLIDHLRYPKSLIKLEGGLIFNKLQKRSDIVIFDRDGHT